jgi:hypothetical protein
MHKPTYITRPCAKPPATPDVATHHDIDWREVSVAEAIDAEAAHYRAMREKLAAVRKGGKTGTWGTLLQVLGIRRVVP